MLELSNDGAVGTGTVDAPSAPAMAPSAVAIDGTGSFGTTEGTPSAWVVLSVGSGVGTVRIDGGAAGSDQMTPVGGLATLALPVADLSGDTIDAIDANGNVISSVTASATGSVPTTPVCTTGNPPPTATTNPATSSSPPEPPLGTPGSTTVTPSTGGANPGSPSGT